MTLSLKNFASGDLPIHLESYIKGKIFDCEIGFGDGRTIVQEAKRCPKKGFVGVEYSIASIKKAEKKVRREGLDNILFIKSEASVAFDILFKERQFNRILVRFPDPWPKKRHIKNRLLNREFFTLAVNKLKDNGEIYIVTDDRGYRDFILEELKVVPYLIPVLSDGYRIKETDETLSQYEEKWRSMGKDIYEIKLKKFYHPEINPHIILSTYFHLPAIKKLNCISNKIIKEGDTILRTGGLNIIGGEREIWIYLIDWHLFQKTKLVLREDGDRFIPMYKKDFLPAGSFELLRNLLESCQ